MSVGGFDHAIDKTPGFRLRGAEGKAGQDQLLCPALADRAGEILRAAGSRHDAERHLGQRKPRICGGIDEIRSGGDLAAAAIGRAIDGRDQRNRAPHHRPHHPLEDRMLRLPAFVGHAVALFQIAAGAKRLVSAAGDDHGAQAFEIDRERLECFHQIEAHPRIQRVRHLRPVQRHQQDVVAMAGHGDGLEIGSHPVLPGGTSARIWLVADPCAIQV